MSHITLIRPPSAITKGQISLTTSPPLGMAYLASTLAKAGHEVHPIDSVGENVFQFTSYSDYISLHGLTHKEVVDRIDRKTDLIGISIMFSQEWPAAKLLLEKIRGAFPSIPILAGGEHVNALPEFVLDNSKAVDYCILGEGEETIVELIRLLSKGQDISQVPGVAYRKNGHVEKSHPRPRMRQVDDIPPPAWHLFPIKNYLDNGLCTGTYHGRSMPIIATRGCPYECTFCSNPGMWTQRWITRDPEKVLREIQDGVEKYDAENFEFCDLTAIVKREWTVKFASRLIESGMKIAWQFPSGTRSEAIDAEVCDLLYRSGCKNLVYAPESGSPAVLKLIKKQVHLDRMVDSMRSALKVGINVRVNFVIGFPGETHRNILESFKFLFRLALVGVHDITHFIFTPYPGSLLFNQLRQSGRIPELNDGYFEDLLAMTDLRKSVSFTDHVKSWQLGFYRIAALCWFYSLIFLMHPWRIFRVVKNIFSEKQESRMELALKNIFLRNRSPLSALRRSN